MNVALKMWSSGLSFLDPVYDVLAVNVLESIEFLVREVVECETPTSCSVVCELRHLDLWGTRKDEE